ncbi:MAG: pyridoxamine 5'-phosphate oxidase family protein [Anaerolineae bacterium]|nr:pyridoxamine 5'-phosphate oxidase family protein [Anaerolineae bacterium]
MATWSEFAAAAPGLAAYGEARFNRARVAFISTISQDGSPRVNPVAPVICQERLLLFIEPSSPKAADLRQDGRYAMHSLVDNVSGIGGEFSIKGRATPIDDPAMRQDAVDASCYTPPDEYVLFELSIDAALSRDYEEGQMHVNRWDEPAFATV